MVKRVELEVNTFCNRKCFFCANAFLDRYSTKEPMSWETYRLILSELKKIDYQEDLVFARYSEPLASPRLLEYLALARQELPSATLYILSNGDYLTREYLKALSDAGLNRLNVSLYPNMHNWTPEESRSAIETFSKKLKLEITPQRENHDSFHFGAKFEGIEIIIKASNLLKVGHDRAGSLPELTPPDFVRTSPCFMPVSTVNIDHNGKVLLCCNTRSDDPNHQDFIFGDLKKEDDLYHSFFNSKFLEWRKTLLSGKAKPYPCTGCKQRDEYNTDIYQKIGKQLEKKFGT
jgi:MoaA/NifB/PqqE/SkfB family radical SAM enzyme